MRMTAKREKYGDKRHGKLYKKDSGAVGQYDRRSKRSMDPYAENVEKDV